jgi:hypothetical protein
MNFPAEEFFRVLNLAVDKWYIAATRVGWFAIIVLGSLLIWSWRKFKAYRDHHNLLFLSRVQLTCSIVRNGTHMARPFYVAPMTEIFLDDYIIGHMHSEAEDAAEGRELIALGRHVTNELMHQQVRVALNAWMQTAHVHEYLGYQAGVVDALQCVTFEVGGGIKKLFRVVVTTEKDLLKYLDASYCSSLKVEDGHETGRQRIDLMRQIALAWDTDKTSANKFVRKVELVSYPAALFPAALAA